MLCEICNQHIWRKYKGGYSVHKNCIVPLQVKAQLKGERSDIYFIINQHKTEKINKSKISVSGTMETTWKQNTIIIDDLDFKEETWKDEPKQRRGEYFNSVKTIRR